jgi:hypothetical protein
VSDYAITPADGWRAGDRAYCLYGSRRTKPTLETGKVYTVEKAEPRKGMVDSRINLVGVALPAGYAGISAGRFIKLRPGVPALDELRRQTARGWLAAYQASTGQAPRPA